MEKDLTMMIVGQARINALIKLLCQVKSEDGEMVKHLMDGVLSSLKDFDLDYLEVARYEKLQKLYLKLADGDYSVLPIKKEDF